MRHVIQHVVLATIVLGQTAGFVCAVEVATGFSDKGDPKSPTSWLAGVETAARKAKDSLKDKAAEVVLVWDNLPMPDAEAQAKILPAITKEFPRATICGQHEPWRWAYSPYTEEGVAIGHGVAIVAIVGAKAKVAQVASGDSDAAKREAFLAKMEELGRSHQPLPQDARLLVVMGAFHGKGDVVAEGLRKTLGGSVPVVGGSSGGVGSVYHEGKVVGGGAVQAILLCGSFSVDTGVAKPMGDWEPQYSQEHKAAAELEALQMAINSAKTANRTPKGFLWFNCQGRCEQPGSFYDKASAQQRRARRTLHFDGITRTAGGLPFWGHFSGAELGPVPSPSHVQGGGYMAVFAVLSEDGANAGR